MRNAKLRLYVTDDGSVQGGAVTATSPADWAEDAITWNTRPAIVGPTLASLAAVATDQWYQLDVTPAVSGDGALGLRLRSTSADEAHYASREEDAHAPQLVVTLVR